MKQRCLSMLRWFVLFSNTEHGPNLGLSGQYSPSVAPVSVWGVAQHLTQP